VERKGSHYAVLIRGHAGQQVPGISKRPFPKNPKEMATWFGDFPPAVMIRKILLLVVFVLPFAAHANPAFRAFDATPIFGESREVIRENNHFSYRFAFRGGTVTYRPKIGAEWKKESSSSADSAAGVPGAGRPYPVFPNGCMVFACARAEEIRRNPSLGTRSQVIGYKRSDGTGHAFVLYEKGGAVYAEDDRGLKVKIPGWKSRTAAEALGIATLFQGRTHPAHFPAPVRASFIGEF
jgi:hypothetical protein